MTPAFNLDVLSPRGIETRRHEQRVARWVASRGARYLETPKHLPAALDAIVERSGELMAVVETKCRYGVDLDQFRRVFGNEWLITADKVKVGIEIARALAVPFIGLLYLVDADVILARNISEARIRYARTETQATVNGGRAVRVNAFVDMTDAPVHPRISEIV